MQTQTIEKREKPIIFSGEMIRKILSGEKTQSRRIMKPQPTGDFCDFNAYGNAVFTADEKKYQEIKNPYEIGDLLWVRETFGDVTKAFEDSDELRNVAFKADDSVWDCYGQMVYLEQIYQSGICVDK